MKRIEGEGGGQMEQPVCAHCGKDIYRFREESDANPQKWAHENGYTIYCEKTLATPIEAASPVEKVAPQGGEEETGAHPRDTHGLVVTWEADDKLFVCRIPEAEGATGHGNTREEAIAMCKDNLHELLKWKAESVAPPSLSGQGFQEWWNSQGRLFMAGNDVHVQRAVMGVCERAWSAARGGR